MHAGASPSLFKCHVTFCKLEGVWIGDGATGRVEESRCGPAASLSNLHRSNLTTSTTLESHTCSQTKLSHR